MKGQSSKKRLSWQLVCKIALVLLVGGFVLYYLDLSIPRRISQLLPGFDRAELCGIKVAGDVDAEPVLFEGKELAELIEHLDSFRFYPYPEGRTVHGVLVLEGDTAWTIDFRVGGKWASETAMVSNEGYLSADGRVYHCRAEEFDPFP